MADSEEVLELRRRARRRLIGAIALVLFLVIVPPWLMDLEPRPVVSNLNVEIPSKDTVKDLRVVPVPPTATGEPAKGAVVPPVEAIGAPKPAPEVSRKDSDKPAAKQDLMPAKPAVAGRENVAKAVVEPPRADKADAAKATKEEADRAAAILKNEVYYVPLGAFNNRENAKIVQQRVAAVGLKAFSDIVEVKGEEQTRVRAGPFANREAAEKARARLKEAGLEPGPVRTR